MEVIVVMWIIFSIVVGFLGNDRKIGFTGALLLALFLSPLVGAVVALSSQRIDPKTVLSPERVKLINSGMKKYNEKNYEGAIQDFQEIVMQPPAPNSHFYLARLYSLLKKRDEAYKHLSKAIEQGFEDFHLITSSSDLAFLRDQADFKEFAMNGYKFTSSKTESDDVISKLEKLGKLKKDGILTEKEFEEQKKKLLNN